MRFGPVAVGEAEGAILAHSVVVGDLRLKKSHVLTAGDIAVLGAAGVADVTAARLDAGDLGEDEAARRIAALFAGPHLDVKPAATGRVNIHAVSPGLFTVDKTVIDAINRVDPAITVATLGPNVAVATGQMVATVKIIPFAVPGTLVGQVEDLCRGRVAFAMHPFAARRAALIQTTLPGTKPSVLDKTARITAARLARSASSIAVERRVPHDVASLAAGIAAESAQADLVIVFGASAMSDPEDVVPAAIALAGGVVRRAGMPVDPGNLIVLGEIDGKPVLGAPGCARSPKENGFDWVLDRILSGVGVTPDDIAGMGVGGLLMEIPTRPQPRDIAPPHGRSVVRAVVLAAGRSSRMGGPNKLLADFGGVPLVRRTVERVLSSNVSGVIVVTGHQADRIAAALHGIDATLVDNPHYATGLASSLKAALAAFPADADGMLVALGDMPEVTTRDLDRLIAAFGDAPGKAAVRATHAGKRGNPVIIPRQLFEGILSLGGDVGARHLIESGDAEVVDVEIGAAASVDVDTPEAMASAGGLLQG